MGRLQMRSPAALAGANRAKAIGHLGKATVSKSKAQTLGPQDFLNGISHAAYDGQRKVGTIVEADRHSFGAFDAADTFIGAYVRQRDAMRAIVLAAEHGGGAA